MVKIISLCFIEQFLKIVISLIISIDRVDIAWWLFVGKGLIFGIMDDGYFVNIP